MVMTAMPMRARLVARIDAPYPTSMKIILVVVAFSKMPPPTLAKGRGEESK